MCMKCVRCTRATAWLGHQGDGTEKGTPRKEKKNRMENKRCRRKQTDKKPEVKERKDVKGCGEITGNREESVRGAGRGGLTW